MDLGRKGYLERGVSGGGTGMGEVTVHSSGESAGNGEPETERVGLTDMGVCGLERREDVLESFGGDAHAVVCDRDSGSVSVGGVGDSDVTATVSDCVGDQGCGRSVWS